MKIIKTKKFAQRYTDELSDDLGLSPEMADPANIDPYDDYEVDPEEDIFGQIRQGGEGIYFSVTYDNPIGPFKTVQEAKVVAKENAQKHSANEGVLEQQVSVKYWLENTEFYSAYWGNRQMDIEELGNYFEATD